MAPPINPTDYPSQELALLILDCTPTLSFLIGVVFLLVAAIPLYVYALVMLHRRRDFQPLKSRSETLIFTSTLGNGLLFTLTLVNKIMSNNYWAIWGSLRTKNLDPDNPPVWLVATCQFSILAPWLAKPMFYFPYLFRSLRLMQIWSVGEEYKLTAREDSQAQPKTSTASRLLINERNLVFIFGIFLAPFIIITAIVTFIPQLAFLLPAFCISQCQAETSESYYDYINSTMEIYLYHGSFQNLLLMICIFIVRKVDVTFSSVSELRWVCTIGVLCSLFESVCLLFLDKTMFVVLGYYQYATLAGLIGILYLTALSNIF